MIVQARKSRGGRAEPASANSRVRQTGWGVRQRAAGVLSALLLGVVTLVSPAPAAAVGATNAGAAATPVQRTLPQQADRPTRSERSERSREFRRDSPRAAHSYAGAPTRAASTGLRTPEHTRQQHAPQDDTGVLPFTTGLPLPRAVVDCRVRPGATAPAAQPSGLPDVRGPPSGSSHPHCPLSAPTHRPR
ncbi:hypothetical protein [Streptomyces sp. NBC_01716]|uniref:hypothetical protein n=1 Tax=Streptomyces sp. NBC_01716 TaxID=2975917 RepID=UPI002E342BEB|nr:hypothetical protein [Streptomyces sp. NBC_01716]